jgi:HAD superfamily hydrolase (TIGR01509 family)
MRPSALLFDMDGTLTRPMLNFPRIRAEMGIAGNQPILEALAAMEPDTRQRAQAVLLRHEEAAAADSALNDGCEQLVRWIRDRDIPLALITRNSRRSADVVLKKHGLVIDLLATRDDGAFKPDPAPLLLACKRLGIAAAHAWMIGDGRYDIEAGQAAGMKTVWLSHGRENREFDAAPWRVVTDLYDLINLLREHVSD